MHFCTTVHVVSELYLAFRSVPMLIWVRLQANSDTNRICYRHTTVRRSTKVLKITFTAFFSVQSPLQLNIQGALIFWPNKKKQKWRERTQRSASTHTRLVIWTSSKPKKKTCLGIKPKEKKKLMYISQNQISLILFWLFNNDSLWMFRREAYYHIQNQAALVSLYWIHRNERLLHHLVVNCMIFIYI